MAKPSKTKTTDNQSTSQTMKSKITWLALATLAAGTFAVSAQEEGRRGGRGGAPRELPPEIVKKYDKDGDGKLNEEETKTAREALQAEREAARKKMIEKFDKDGDGKLNDEERKAAREAAEARQKELIAKYDADKDGKLSREERQKAIEAGEEMPAFGFLGGGPGGRRGGGGGGAEGGEKPQAPEKAPEAPAKTGE